jgi:peptidoglycan/LPS O-acetylase OafA/YrhL
VKSSEGVHFVGLDHARALAVFLVFGNHTIEAARQYGASLSDAHSFLFNSFFNQGHTGVALFMTLSGYLFARLVEGRDINMRAFLANRALRLFPLLLVILAIRLDHSVLLEPNGLIRVVFATLAGTIYPVWPNGGWSITVELHFYLLFPFLLAFARNRVWPLLLVPALAIAFRFGIYVIAPDRMQDVAYWTIIGRIDQFVLGMALAKAGHLMLGKHGLAAAISLVFAVALNRFDVAGGIADEAGLAALWIWWPTFEGLCFAFLIAWYDRSFSFSDRGFSHAIAKIGQWSYSIYLLHFFFVWPGMKWLIVSLYPVDSFVEAASIAVIGFTVMLIPASLSYRFIETPFLKRRVKYLTTKREPFPDNCLPSGLAGIHEAR